MILSCFSWVKFEIYFEVFSNMVAQYVSDAQVTAGGASGVSDGAAALVLADEEAVKKQHLQPLARLVGWQTVGCDPSIMGIGPVPATRALLKKAGVKQADVGLFEVRPDVFSSRPHQQNTGTR